MGALPQLLTLLKLVDSLLDLRAQVCAVKRRFMNHVLTIRAIPAQAIEALRWSLLLNHYANLLPPLLH